MEISKFLVGLLTIATGLFAAGRLTPAVVKLANNAVAAQKDYQDFKISNWNRRLSHMSKK